MKRLLFSLALVSVVTLSGWLVFSDRDSVTPTEARYAQLERQLKHAGPDSPEAPRLQRKLDRMAAEMDGQPRADSPDVFTKILYEMRIPSDRTEPEYRPGYRTRELKRTPHRFFAEKTLTWTARGPGNVAGRARGIIVDPDDATGLTWFIASVGGGVWKTTDGGSTWQVLTDALPNLAVQSIAMAASNHDVMYAGTGESYFNIDTMNGNGMFKTADRGATWTQLATTLDDPRFNNVSRIIVSPSDPDVVLASTTTGTYKQSLNSTSSIFRSTDGGATWTEVLNLGSQIQQIMADPTDFNVQYACVRNVGIYKSTDAGLTWSTSSGGITDTVGRFEMAISPVNHNYLYAASQGSSHAMLWVSLDAGATWTETFESGTEPNWLGSQGWYDNTIVCHPSDPTIVYVGGTELYKIVLDSLGSTNRTSTPMASYSYPHPDHHFLAVIQPAVGPWFLLGTNDGGLTRTSGGETGFTMPINGMVTTQFYGVDKMPGGSAYIGGMQDNGTWMSPANSTIADAWSPKIGGDGYETDWHFDDPTRVMGGYQYNGLARSLDGGATWISATSGLGDTGSGNAPFITKIGQSNARPDVVFAVGAQGVWRSTDFGGNWSLSTTPLSEWGPLSSFHDVRVSGADPDIVWAGSRMDGTGSLVVSTDGGATFTGTNDFTDVVMGRISGLATDPFDANTAYALFSYAARPKILKTTDLGATWADISGFGTGSTSTNGFPDVAVYDLLVWPNDANRIWVGTEIGLMESLDGGATWALANNGLPAVGIWMIRAVEDEIIVATHGRGIWTTTDSALETNLTFNPLLGNLYQTPSGSLAIEMNLRSAYDSTQVFVDGSKVLTYSANAPRQLETLEVPVMTTATRSVYARGFKDGGTYDSVLKSIDVYTLSSPEFTYSNNLDSGGDFAMTGFSIQTPAGFSNAALHSPHNYADNSGPVAMLTVPVVIAAQTDLSFDEIAIVEPGDPGTVFGDSGFWDFVTVEGSLDGITWQTLDPAGAWDCRAYPDWESAFNSQNGNESMYHNRTIDLNQTFTTGDVILLRFRLFADAYVNGWGWAIDNVAVTPHGISGAGDTPRAMVLNQNYPNPFNPATTISFNLPADGRAKLEIFDARGRLVRTLLDGRLTAGPHDVTWNGRDNHERTSAAGVYLYRLTAGQTVLQDKMTLVK